MGLLSSCFKKEERSGIKEYDPKRDRPKTEPTKTVDDLLNEVEPVMTNDTEIDDNTDSDVEEPDVPVDLTKLAIYGAELEITNYVSRIGDTEYEYDLSLIISPDLCGGGTVKITCNYSDDTENPDIITLVTNKYVRDNIETLKNAINSAITTSIKQLKNEELAAESLDQYLDEIEEELQTSINNE